MAKKNDPISGVPTNIITGFLGVGKTSAILNLLNNKPENERWAILVNEFGEIGIDGSIFESQYTEEQGVYIREVPGGCMCCTAGTPMQVALAQLLRKAKPDRLLIEPTGLGHPSEVLQTLNNDNFQDILEIQKVITLVDARQLSDSRYVEHKTFQQQLAIADVIVANKKDLYAHDDKLALESYLHKHSLHNVPLLFTEYGVIEHEVLNGLKASKFNQSFDGITFSLNDKKDTFNEPIPECGYIKAVNKGEGFASIGWRFSSNKLFDRDQLFSFLSGVKAERLKATFITNDGCFAYNLTQDACSEILVEDVDESRIEIIALNLNNNWEKELFSSISSNDLDIKQSNQS